jgi:endonuclease/exonuclease/phosphatase family metal-dependent hydrolase
MVPMRPPSPAQALAPVLVLVLVLVLALALALLPGRALAVPSQAVDTRAGTTLRLATWNLEWLMSPAQFAALAPACVPAGGEHRGQRSIPCDVAAGLERGAADYAALARVAGRLDADVVALQEVDGVRAAQLVFTGYAFCFTGGPAVQNTGFAVRTGIPYRCEADYSDLSLGDTLRRGAALVLYPGTRREIHLLGVHLKSGCARGPVGRREKPCERLAEQAPRLAAWAHAQAAAGHAFALLGDFNRDLLAESRTGNTGLWRTLNDARDGAPLENTAERERYRNCRRGQRASGYIDYILLGGALRGRARAGSFERITYDAGEAWRLKLSDHCPVALSLRVD